MPFEDAPPPPTIVGLPPELRALLHWRKCDRCGAVRYCLALEQCGHKGCPGRCWKPPAWKTMLAPRMASGEPCTLEYCP